MEVVGSNSENKDRVRENLVASINNYKINTDTLSEVTKLDKSWIKDYLTEENSIEDLSTSDQFYLSDLSAFLSEAIVSISNDQRLKGIIESLVEVYKVEYETLALYSKVNIKDIHRFMEDVNCISYEKKYNLAVTVMFLHYIFKK